ncbi:MAG: TonB-dependent receptor domain-containing protein [Cyclobacteriaceae bacterium]
MLKYTIYAIIIFLISSLSLRAQSANEVSGQVLDAESSEPVSFAQVALYEPGNDTPVTGGVTDESGNFALEAKAGEYTLEIVFVGYQEKRIKNINLEDGSARLKDILIEAKTERLDEVVVEADEVPQPVSTDLEGMSIRPDQTISNIGGTLLDVLRNSPSVSVSQDGTVTLRGSNNTNILIDGRNSALASDLEQIPASAIESIKIVNNPNARYDAEGEGGVINIKLKQDEDLGDSGSVQGTFGSRGRTNASLRLNKKAERYSVFGGYSYRSWPSVGYSSTNRLTFDDDERLEQFADRERDDSEHTLNLGGDYFIGKNKLSYEGTFNMENESNFENNRTQLFDINSDDLLLQYTRNNNETEENYTLDNALIYERIFDNPEREFRALVSRSVRDQLENQMIDIYSGTINPDLETPSGRERASNDELRRVTIVQADYVHPLAEGKIEAGYKSTFRYFDNDYLYERRDMNTGTWINQDDVSNRFLYQDQIHAAYAIYSTSLNDVDISMGARLEQTMVDTRLYDTDEENEQNYLNLFPSFQALYNLSEKHDVKFTYSRRIDRPNGWRLNPFPDVADSLNIRIGNPNLQPEFIQSLELGHMAQFEKADLTTNLFYRRVNGQVDYIVFIEDGISYRQPTNLNTSTTYGVELINTTQLTDWWSLNASYSLFRIEVDGTNLDNSFTNAGISWNAKLNTDFKLPYEVNLQFTANYDAPEIEAQGRDLARYYLDMSLQRPIFDEKGSVSLSLRDVFDTWRFAGENAGSDFVQTFEYKRETRILLLSMRYSLF